MISNPFFKNSKVGLLVSLVPCWFLGQTSAACLPEPIDIRIGNVTFEDYNNNVIRGLDISMGSPEQRFAFLPQMPLNNTFVYGVEDPLCGKSWSTNGCATFRGGLYDNTSSSSIGTAAADSHPPKGDGYPPCEWVTDDVTLSSNTTVDDFAFGIALKDWGEQGYHPQSALGVGSNSSILNSLKQAGQIASRTWSMFWGLEGATVDTQMDGIFVMGGYDRAKTSGPNYTTSLSYTNPNCLTGMVVTISDITLNLANGSSASMFGGVNSAAVTACIDPDYPVLMALPYTYFSNFETITDAFIDDRAFGINYYGMMYDEDTKPYTGDLTITLSNGLSVRITNDQLVIPELTVDEKSGAIISNSSTPELILNSQQAVNENDIARLGRQFFTAAYIMVNHDTDQYTLWEGNATTEKDLVVVDENNTVHPDPCSDDTPSSSSSSEPSAQQESGISSGGIAGAVVGSVAGVSLIIGALFFLLRKKKKNAASQNMAPPPDKGSDKQPVDLTPRAAQELPGDSHASVVAPRELPDNVARQELPGGSETAFISELPEKPEVTSHRAELE